MSYLVLARKWRPQKFEEVIGQSHVTRALQNALSTGKVAHALIFSGPRGVGKTSVARILSKALNCDTGPAPDPCNQCEICRQITVGSCVDVNEIDGASNRGIDEIRQLREEIRFQPVLCRFRIYIIDEVHMLTKEAFNALLKTLEEPPPHAYFIFATTEPRKIPETIHSRCQHYEFRRLSETDLAAHLDKIIEKEGLGLPQEASLLLARQAQGSVRDSLSLLDQVAAYGAKSYEEVCQALGVAGTKTVEELAKALLASDVQEALSTLQKTFELGVDLQRLAQDLLKFLRDLAVLKKVDENNASTLTNFSPERMQEIRQKFSDVEFFSIVQAMEMLSSTMDELYKGLNPRINLEILFMKICSLDQLATIDEVLDRLEVLICKDDEKDLIEQATYDKKVNDTSIGSQDNRIDDFKAKISEADSARQISQKKKSAKPSPKPEPSIDNCIEQWDEFVHFIKDKNPSLGSLLDSCLEVNPKQDGRLLVTCTDNFKGEMLCDRDKSRQINILASQFFKRPVDIAFEIKKEKGALSKSAKSLTETVPKANPREELVKNPLVQEAINIFQARISGVTLYNKRNNNRSRS